MDTPLQKIRKSKNITLQKLSAEVGIDSSNLSRIERGIQSVSPVVAEKICIFFNHEITEMQIFYPDRYKEVA